MSGPEVRNDGETWQLNWESIGLNIWLERVARKHDDIYAYLSVESQRPGRVGHMLGPQRLNLVSAQSQQTAARSLQQRLKLDDKDLCHDVIVQSCAIVLTQFMAPSPSVKLSDPVDMGPIEYLAPQIPEGETTFIYGDSESCKSLIALTIGMCVQAGVCLPWSRQPIPQRNVLVLDWETNQRTMGWRLRRLAQGMPEPMEPPEITYRGTLWNRKARPLHTLSDEVPALREQIAREDIGLVILDSIGFAVTGKLVDDDVARQAIADLRMLAPTTRLVVAHISRESARQLGGRVDPFGSAFFRAGLRSGFEARRSEDEVRPGRVSLGIYHWKANDDLHTPPFGLSVDFDGLSGPIHIQPSNLMAVDDLAARTPATSRIRAFLLEHGELPVFQIADDLDLPAQTVHKALKRGEGTTFVRTDGQGRGAIATWGVIA